MQKKYGKVPGVLLLAAGGLLLLVLYMAAGTHNSITQNSTRNGYEVVAAESFGQMEREDAPIGTVYWYRFALKEIRNSDSLMFYINHHAVSVWLDGECVYSMKPSGQNISTGGGIWVQLPLAAEDMGKTVCVVLAPVYSDYQNQVPEFMVGSEMAICQSIFYQALPEVVMSLCVVLAGIFLLGLAIYHSIKKDVVPRLYAIGMLSVSAGVWRFTYEEFAYLIFQEQSVFLYTLSIISLMVIALSMLHCVEFLEDGAGRDLICKASCIYCLIDAGQFLLQFFGVLDLRQMLKFTHGMLIVSAIVLCISAVAAWKQKSVKRVEAIIHGCWESEP